MIDKQLKVGDHIVDAEGHLYVIDAMNKKSYRARMVDGYYGSETVPFDGMQRRYRLMFEYFVCDDVQQKIIADLGKKNRELEQKQEKMEQDVAIARTLKQNFEWLCCGKLSDLEQRQDYLEQRQNDEEDEKE